MRVLLLNNGGFPDLENVKFPVEVEAEPSGDTGVDIKGSELLRVGATQTEEDPWDEDYDYYFSFLYGECVAVDED